MNDDFLEIVKKNAQIVYYIGCEYHNNTNPISRYEGYSYACCSESFNDDNLERLTRILIRKEWKVVNGRIYCPEHSECPCKECFGMLGWIDIKNDVWVRCRQCDYQYPEKNKMDLNYLVGLTVEDAKAFVQKSGFEPDPCGYNEMRPSIALNKNVVQLIHKNGIVIKAQTQESIDKEQFQGLLFGTKVI